MLISTTEQELRQSLENHAFGSIEIIEGSTECFIGKDKDETHYLFLKDLQNKGEIITLNMYEMGEYKN